jgi:hypothetical protein
MYEFLRDMAKNIADLWTTLGNPIPGDYLVFRFGNISVSLNCHFPEVLIPGENIAGAVYIEEPEAVPE